MKITGNNDGNLGGGKSRRQVKKEKQARAAATGKSMAQIQEYNNRMNSGSYAKNDHGLPDGGSVKGVGTSLAGSGAGEGDAKFRKARRPR